MSRLSASTIKYIYDNPNDFFAKMHGFHISNYKQEVMALGNAFHKVIECYYKLGVFDIGYGIKEFDERLVIDGITLDEETKEKYMIQLSNLCNNFPIDLLGTPTDCEKEISIKQDIPFIGYIDYLDTFDGKIVDYKGVSSFAYDNRAKYLIQLSLYAYRYYISYNEIPKEVSILEVLKSDGFVKKGDMNKPELLLAIQEQLDKDVDAKLTIDKLLEKYPVRRQTHRVVNMNTQRAILLGEEILKLATEIAELVLGHKPETYAQKCNEFKLLIDSNLEYINI